MFLKGHGLVQNGNYLSLVIEFRLQLLDLLQTSLQLVFQTLNLVTSLVFDPARRVAPAALSILKLENDLIKLPAEILYLPEGRLFSIVVLRILDALEEVISRNSNSPCEFVFLVEQLPNLPSVPVKFLCVRNIQSWLLRKELQLRSL